MQFLNKFQNITYQSYSWGLNSNFQNGILVSQNLRDTFEHKLKHWGEEEEKFIDPEKHITEENKINF